MVYHRRRVPRTLVVMPDAVLFLCVANSSRSQMAEGIARVLLPHREVRSAGSAPTQVNPYAIRAMAELGIDLGTHASTSIADVPRDTVSLVVTLCAEEVCPVFPGHVETLHWPLRDPAAVQGDDETKLAAFREVRDQIRSKLEAWFDRRLVTPA